MPESPESATLQDMGLRRPSRGLLERWPNATDLAISLASFILTMALWDMRGGEVGFTLTSWADVAAYLCAFSSSFALLWRRSHPLWVHGVILGAAAVVYIGGAANGIVALAFSLYSLGRYESHDGRSVAGAIVAVLVLAWEMETLVQPGAGNTMACVAALVTWYMGRRLRFRGEYLRLLEERALNLERARTVEAEQAVTAERTRIAREMHDVVAHQVSLMTVQAGAARTVGAKDPEAASQAMAEVESAGRTALKEMRGLLDVLRPMSAPDELKPQPGIDDIGALVRQTSAAGPQVKFVSDGDFSSLPRQHQLTIYRIVQEALTNVMKHAGSPVRVAIELKLRHDQLQLSIRDDGQGSSASSGHGQGHGLVGMRERVELLGGSLDFGANCDGGFAVTALLPVHGESP